MFDRNGARQAFAGPVKPVVAKRRIRLDFPAMAPLPESDGSKLDGAVADLAAMCDQNITAIERLQAAIRLQRLAEIHEAIAIADLAQQHKFSDVDEYDIDDTTRRPVRVGADGTWIDETLSLEIACAKRMSAASAAWYLRDIVNLVNRHPYSWQAVQQGMAPLWQARQVAAECSRETLQLTAQQTKAIDKQISGPGGPLGRIGWGRLRNAIQAAILAEAPHQVAAARAAQRASRYARIQPDDADPASAWATAHLDLADATFLDATVDRLADILGEQGDQNNKDHRRAKALAILATPAHALSLLSTHTKNSQTANSALPTTQVYVHVHEDALRAGASGNRTGICRVENYGPAFVEDLKAILGHSRVRLTPVIHLADADEPAVDAYEIPQRIREHIINRDRYEVFPYSSRQARHQDLDHTIPYKPDGPPGQTRPSNLGPLSRQAHRAKTHAGWKLQQPTPGVFHWTTGLGQQFQVGPTGTTPTQPPDT